MLAGEIRERAAQGRTLVLGLPTGATPVPLYTELIRLHQEEDLSFRNVLTFNLDEYYGLPRGHPQSYHAFMRRTLFDHLDIPSSQTHLPDGMVAEGEVPEHCAAYEEKIRAAGGIDLQLLGIGRSGHIGFNEPGAEQDSVTRLVPLCPITRQDAAPAFGGLDRVPTHAITMGVSTILRARRITLLAWGSGKAGIVARAYRTSPTPDLPASFLHTHENCSLLLDREAASELNIPKP